MELFMNMWTDYALWKIDIVCYMLKTANMLNYESMPLLMTVQKGINKCLRYKKAVNWYPRHWKLILNLASSVRWLSILWEALQEITPVDETDRVRWLSNLQQEITPVITWTCGPWSTVIWANEPFYDCLPRDIDLVYSVTAKMVKEVNWIYDWDVWTCLIISEFWLHYLLWILFLYVWF